MFETLPAAWRRVPLSSLGQRVRRRNTTGNTNVLTISAVHGLVNQKEFFNKIVASENLSNYFLLKSGEFAYNKSYSNGYPVGVVRRLKRYQSGILSPLYICFDMSSSEVDERYAELFFDSQWFIDEINQIAKEGARNHGLLNVGVGEFFDLEFVLPPLPEQQKIAAILSSVDDVIEKTRAQIDKLKDLKTGMMQELLTKGIGHTEFKDSPLGRIPKAWSLIELGKVLTGIDSGWSPSCGDRSPGTSEWGVLKVSAVTRGEFLESESKTLPEHLAPREKIQVHKGDVLLTRANGVAELVGKCVIVRREPQAKLMMSDKILRLKPTEKLFNEFLLHVFNARSTRKQIELCWGGSSGQKNIGQADIRNFIIPLPSLEEQKIIAKSITQIDHTLYHKNRKLQSLIGSKKALMQDLLTGKVRVKVDQKESAVA
ncbi:restriction endonuclease subunit S [Marinobacter sp. VGCF2001]|uniref:restriction endonuclease subunit S n=1 Tax=Marinobacter sp. VGCF2001 TaxID=3417189 RepID=UPI003CFA93B2